VCEIAACDTSPIVPALSSIERSLDGKRRDDASEDFTEGRYCEHVFQF
jgi:hypothetical protein